MGFFIGYYLLCLLLVRPTLAWHAGSQLALRTRTFSVAKFSPRTNLELKYFPLSKSSLSSIWSSSVSSPQADRFQMPTPTHIQLAMKSLMKSPEHSSNEAISIESNSFLNNIRSILDTLAPRWSTCATDLRADFVNLFTRVNRAVKRVLHQPSNHSYFHGLRSFVIGGNHSSQLHMSSVLRILANYSTAIRHSANSFRIRICSTDLEEILLQRSTNLQRTSNTFRTLFTAIKELSAETTASFGPLLAYKKTNRTMRIPQRDLHAEDQFSRVKAICRTRSSETHNNQSEQTQRDVLYNVTTLSAFVGKLYRQGRILFGAKAQQPTENLSEAVLAYLAAADSLGIAFKDLSAVAAAEQSTRPTQSTWYHSLTNRWRRQPINSSHSDCSKSLPSKADFAFVHARRTEMAINAALAVHSSSSAQDFVKHVSIQPLLVALQVRPCGVDADFRVNGVRSLSILVRFHPPLAVGLASMPEVVTVLCDMLEAPHKRFAFWKSPKNAARQEKEQFVAAELVLRIVRSSDLAVDILRQNQRLRKDLLMVGEFHATSTTSVESSQWARDAVKELEEAHGSAKPSKSTQSRKPSNGTFVGEHPSLQASQMARIAAWGLGGVPWQPRRPGQKGLRILSLDGGGTRGVLSIAILREIMKRVHADKDRGQEPHQMFDIICGTSTGGIIATLLGTQRASLSDTETLYDAFIDKIFGSRSNMRLMTSQAAYDERDWEKILHDMCGDALMLDSNQHDCPRVFCVSARANTHPPTPNLWRNYNYPPGQVARYPGACRVNTFTAIRSTTAAPTFFTPVHWEEGLYFDGALVANNPTAIALQEAKLLYPNVPVELVVSIGTGLTATSPSSSSARSMGWDVLVNQLIASSTDTEDVHALLHNFLPPEKYFRFNPILPDIFKIDEKNKTVLSALKNLARKTIDEVESGSDSKLFAQLVKTLRA